MRWIPRSAASRRFSAVTLAALGCVVLSACAGSVRAGTVVVSGARTGPGVKKVVAKRPPERLLADDGSGCDVSPDRFRDTPVGALFDCPDWRDEPPR